MNITATGGHYYRPLAPLAATKDLPDESASGPKTVSSSNNPGVSTLGINDVAPGSVTQGRKTEASSEADKPATRERQVKAQEQLQEAQEIQELSQRDQEVKTHERIHAAIAGAHGGPPQYEFKRGPDGVMYVVSGHVNIDLSPVPGNPKATLEKAQTIQRAALGPSDPSPADRAVAAKASAMASRASAELLELEKQMAGLEPGLLISTRA